MTNTMSNVHVVTFGQIFVAIFFDVARHIRIAVKILGNFEA